MISNYQWVLQQLEDAYVMPIYQQEDLQKSKIKDIGWMGSAWQTYCNMLLSDESQIVFSV